MAYVPLIMRGRSTAHLRQMFEQGAALSEWQRDELEKANARCIDRLSRVVGDSLDFAWLPGVEEGEARRMLGRSMVLNWNPRLRAGGACGAFAVMAEEKGAE